MSGDHNQYQKDKSFECPRCGRCCTDEYERGFVEGMQHQMKSSVEKTLEPVAWADMAVRGEDKGLSWTPGHFHKTPLYTEPPKKEWQGLTDGEIEDLYFDGFSISKLKEFARAIERAHGIKEKNT